MNLEDLLQVPYSLDLDIQFSELLFKKRKEGRKEERRRKNERNKQKSVVLS
ncbi:MAG: hypothetical protein ACI8RD_009051 [Bacillariaceae sp.]|jgi:hypothetical protein